jgi:hypothetical protein
MRPVACGGMAPAGSPRPGTDLLVVQALTTAITGDAGRFGIGLLVTQALKWRFHPQDLADVGIDGQIGPVLGGRPSGRLLEVQIKSGPSRFGIAGPGTATGGCSGRTPTIARRISTRFAVCRPHRARDPGQAAAFFHGQRTANTPGGRTTTTSRARLQDQRGPSLRNRLHGQLGKPDARWWA